MNEINEGISEILILDKQVDTQNEIPEFMQAFIKCVMKI